MSSDHLPQAPITAGVDLELTAGKVSASGSTWVHSPGFPKDPVIWDPDVEGRIKVQFTDGSWWTGDGFAPAGRMRRRLRRID